MPGRGRCLGAHLVREVVKRSGHRVVTLTGNELTDRLSVELRPAPPQAACELFSLVEKRVGNGDRGLHVGSITGITVSRAGGVELLAALPSLLVVSLPPGPAPATGWRPAFLVGGESAGRPRPDVAPLLSGERAVPRVNALKAI